MVPRRRWFLGVCAVVCIPGAASGDSPGALVSVHMSVVRVVEFGLRDTDGVLDATAAFENPGRPQARGGSVLSAVGIRLASDVGGVSTPRGLQPTVLLLKGGSGAPKSQPFALPLLVKVLP